MADKETALAEKDLDISVNKVEVEETRDEKPDFVRLKYVDTDQKKVVGYTNVAILAD